MMPDVPAGQSEVAMHKQDDDKKCRHAGETQSHLGDREQDDLQKMDAGKRALVKRRSDNLRMTHDLNVS